MRNIILTDSDILERINSKLDKLLKMEENPVPSEWITTEVVCDRLDITPRCLQNYKNQGIIGFTKLFGKNYFKYSDIVNQLNKNYVPPFERK